MAKWYKVEFCGQMPEGETPTVPADFDELLDLGRHFAGPFGFMVIDSISVTEVDGLGTTSPSTELRTDDKFEVIGQRWRGGTPEIT